MSDSKGFLHWLFFKKWHPVPSVGSTIALFSIIGVIFVVLGIVITVINNNIQEVTIYKYDQKCSPVEYNKKCSFTYKFDQMKAPIYFYYELENFYQNHRRYVKSKSSTQLSGEEISLSDAEKYCEPIIYNKDLEEWQQVVYITEDNILVTKESKPDDIASPCGLVAKSFFNDTYELSLSGKKIELNQTGISWPNDKGKKYKRAHDSENTQWIDPENEHFIVWMRTAGLPTFRKLWGRIEQDIEEGEYIIEFQNNYNPQMFAGAKNIVLSTSGPFGGKNLFLSIAFIVVGVIQLLIALAFLIKKIRAGPSFGQKNE
ncbi:unnamed protein product [Paramecium sonneborni]|uniref:Cell cycle control protein n=1 Tax=Paramecium sonneborni TaxID=65129 RepID=A0A8S1RE64_9CILI|nr:unnamed protein product [Paramecium sonneborni]